MGKTRLTFGGVLLIAGAAIALLLAALRWVGSNAHAIDSGMSTVINALLFVIVLAGLTVGAIWLVRNRHLLVKRAEPAAPPAIHAQAQQVPVYGAGPAPALAPGQVPALAAGQIPALAPGQVPGLPGGASGPIVVYGMDHQQLGALLRGANLAAASSDPAEEGGAGG